MTVKELKSIISKLPDNAKIKIAYNFKVDTLYGKSDRCQIKDIDDIATVIDQDSNMGSFVINTKE